MRMTGLFSPLWSKRYHSFISLNIYNVECCGFFVSSFFQRAYLNANAQRNKVAMGTLALNSVMCVCNTTNVVLH